jgi:excisionase family DNA binding protein
MSSEVTRYVSTGEAARRLEVAPRTVLRWIKAGRMPARKDPGGRLKVSVQVVEALLASGEPEQTEAVG